MWFEFIDAAAELPENIFASCCLLPQWQMLSLSSLLMQAERIRQTENTLLVCIEHALTDVDHVTSRAFDSKIIIVGY